MSLRFAVTGYTEMDGATTLARYLIPALVFIPLTSSAQGADVRHPRTEFIRAINAPVTTIRLADSIPEAPSNNAGYLAELAGLATARTSKQPRFTKSAFGSVVSAGFDREGNLFVLDDRINELSWFDGTGKRIQTIGKRGNNSGEFTEPKDLEVTATGDVIVGDFGRRLHIFRRSKSGYEKGETLRMPFPIEDVCTIGAEIVVHSRPISSPELIHVLNRKGEVVRSFGELYRSKNRYVDSGIGKGQIACANDRSLVAYAPTAAVPEIRAFDLNGHPRWRVRIDGFIPMDIIQPRERPNAVRVSIPPLGFHRIQSLLYDGSGTFLVQVAFVSAATAVSRGQYDRLFTFFISADNGASRLLSDKVGLIGAITPTQAALIRAGTASSIELFAIGPSARKDSSK